MTFHKIVITCPDCGDTNAQPVSLEACSDGMIRLTLHCPKCDEDMRWTSNMAHLIGVSALLDHFKTVEEQKTLPEPNPLAFDEQMFRDFGISN